MADRGRRGRHATGPGRGLCLERVPDPADQGVRLVDLRGHRDLHPVDLLPGRVGGVRRPLDGQGRPTDRRPHRRRALWRGGLPGQPVGRQAVVAVPDLRGPGRDRARLRLHRAGGHPGQVVPGQAGHDHRHRGGRLRRRRAGHGADRHPADRVAGGAAHLRHPRRHLPDHGRRRGPAHAQPPRRGTGRRGGSRRSRRRRSARPGTTPSERPSAPGSGTRCGRCCSST